ncbi:uncharacterized protein LOC117870492 [Trachemys scripta elegans]|uniref:uncharacterized protein LOC117870492 n=1 Tax=Trachemys scripta elegans TaxID=31138 RepID=UPI001556AD60|nr:uncharacterized protein LOC117870492 [Trachemys scripta elegans]
MALLTRGQQSMIARGMKYLVSLANNLSISNKTPDVHKEIREDAHRACEEMTEVVEQLEKQLLAIDDQTVDLIDKKSQLNNEMNERKLSQDLLQIQLKYSEKTNVCAQEMQRTAEKHLGELKEMQKKTSLYMAQRAAQELQGAIGLYETKVSEYKQNTCKCNIEKEEIEVKIEANKKRIDEINLERSASSRKEDQKRVRKHVNFLGRLAEEVKIVKSKVQHDSDYEIAWEPLETIAEMWRDKDGQEVLNFLDQEEISALVCNLKEIIESRADNEA